MENLFLEFKAEIIKRAKEAQACEVEFKKAVVSENFNELIKVITENFSFCCERKIIDCKLLSTIGQEICNENNLFFNISSENGFIIADSATVRASGSATVRASGSATVEASGSATVEAWGSATVRASGSATVEASGSATVEASGSAYIDSRNTIEHKISDKVILRYYYENKIVFGENIKL